MRNLLSLIFMFFLTGCYQSACGPKAATVAGILMVGDESRLEALLEKCGLEKVEHVVGKPLLFEIQSPWVNNGIKLSAIALRYGAGIDAKYGGDTALMAAVMWGRVRDVEFLLERGASPTIRSKDGKRAVDFIPESLREDEREVLVKLLKEV